jgi:hypothetical protein
MPFHIGPLCERAQITFPQKAPQDDAPHYVYPCGSAYNKGRGRKDEAEQ